MEGRTTDLIDDRTSLERYRRSSPDLRGRGKGSGTEQSHERRGDRHDLPAPRGAFPLRRGAGRPLPVGPAWCRRSRPVTGHAVRDRRGYRPPDLSRRMRRGLSISGPQCRSLTRGSRSTFVASRTCPKCRSSSKSAVRRRACRSSPSRAPRRAPMAAGSPVPPTMRSASAPGPATSCRSRSSSTVSRRPTAVSSWSASARSRPRGTGRGARHRAFARGVHRRRRP